MKIVMHGNGVAWIKNQRARSRDPGSWHNAPLYIGELAAKITRNRSTVRAMIDQWWIDYPTQHKFFDPCDDLPWDVHMIANRTAHAMAAQAYRAARI